MKHVTYDLDLEIERGKEACECCQQVNLFVFYVVAMRPANVGLE